MKKRDWKSEKYKKKRREYYKRINLGKKRKKYRIEYYSKNKDKWKNYNLKKRIKYYEKLYSRYCNSYLLELISLHENRVKSSKKYICLVKKELKKRGLKNEKKK